MVVRSLPLPAPQNHFVCLSSVFPAPYAMCEVISLRSNMPALPTGTRDCWLLILLPSFFLGPQIKLGVPQSAADRGALRASDRLYLGYPVWNS